MVTRYFASAVCDYELEGNIRSIGTNVAFTAEKLNRPALFNLQKLCVDRFFNIFKDNALKDAKILNIYIPSITKCGDMEEEEWSPKDFTEAMENLQKLKDPSK